MTIDHIIHFQRKYKIKRIENILNLFQSNIKSLNFNDYDNLTKQMRDSGLLNLTNILLFRINRYLNPSKKSISRKQTRIFLSAYILKHYPNEVFTTVNNKFRSQLSAIANDLVEYVHNDFLRHKDYKNYSLNRFGHIFNTYFINYEELMKIDKKGLINELVLEYYNTNITIEKIKQSDKYDSNQKDRSVYNLIKHMNQIKSEINLLEPNNDIVDNLEIYIEKINFVKNKYNEEILDNIHTDLVNENYNSIMDVFSDINDMMTSDLDLEEIKTELENKDLDYEFFYLCSDIYDDLKIPFDEDLIISNFDFNKLLILFIKDLYKKMDNKISYNLIDLNIA